MAGIRKDLQDIADEVCEKYCKYNAEVKKMEKINREEADRICNIMLDSKCISCPVGKLL